MSDLRLHQTIYADSSCYFSGQIVEIHKTTLVDAITTGDKYKATSTYRSLADAIISSDKYKVR